MSWSTFERIYKPTTDQPLGFFELPKGIDAHSVWTLTEGDGGELYVNPGWHVVNRLGYYVTEKPWNDLEAIDLWVKW